jgi:hypothetical protein
MLPPIAFIVMVNSDLDKSDLWIIMGGYYLSLAITFCL